MTKIMKSSEERVDQILKKSIYLFYIEKALFNLI